MSDKTLGVNPWTRIWTHPREAVRNVVNYNPKFRFIFLSFIYGFLMSILWAQDLSLGTAFPPMQIVLASLVLATFIGMLSITVGSALIYWTGKWIGGTGEYYPVRAAVTWSNVPNVFSVIIWAVLIYLYKDQVFLADFQQAVQSPAITATFVVLGILAIWSFVMLIKGIAEVQGFSAWKGLLNVLIPFFGVGILIWVVTWVISVAFAIIGM